MNEIKKIQVIINPAAGKNEPVLNILNQVFQNYKVYWQVDVTHGIGDACRLAREAVEAGADLVAGYGGDGTLMEIVNGLQGSNVPLGILPGGTGNGIARELGIPLNLARSAQLLCEGSTVRRMDLGRINDHYFMLHAYTGIGASQIADRASKDALGILAYLLPILRIIREPQLSHYFLTIDGQEIEEDGIICMVLNASGLGIELPLKEPIEVRDGLLDLLLLKKDIPAAVNSLLTLQKTEEIFQHWQGREITVRCDPIQEFWTDGEPGGHTPFTAVIAPQALRLLAPNEQ